MRLCPRCGTQKAESEFDGPTAAYCADCRRAFYREKARLPRKLSFQLEYYEAKRNEIEFLERQATMRERSIASLEEELRRSKAELGDLRERIKEAEEEVKAKAGFRAATVFPMLEKARALKEERERKSSKRKGEKSNGSNVLE